MLLNSNAQIDRPPTPRGGGKPNSPPTPDPASLWYPLLHSSRLPFPCHDCLCYVNNAKTFLFCRRCNAFVATPHIPLNSPSPPKNLFGQLLGVAKSFSFFLRPANRTNNSTQLAECFAISALLNLLKICEANAQNKKEGGGKKERKNCYYGSADVEIP